MIYNNKKKGLSLGIGLAAIDDAKKEKKSVLIIFQINSTF